MTSWNVQSLHSSRAGKSVSATSPVGDSPQAPAKQTAETNYSANSIGEHPEGTHHAHQKPTAETINLRKTRKTPSYTIDSPPAKTRRNGSRMTMRRQRSGVRQQPQSTERCCHQSINNNHRCVVPITTRHEHRTPPTAETIEDIFNSYSAAGGTDRRSKRSETQPASENHRSGFRQKASSTEKPSCAEDPP
jgi:hypothetical protein